MKYLTTTALVILSVLIVSCSKSSTPYQTSSQLTDKLLEVSKQGPQNSIVQLSELTDFEWDTVFYFLDGTPRKTINSITGLSVFEHEEGRYYAPGALLVFKHGDKVAHAISISPPLYISGFSPKAHQYANAKLRAHSNNPGPYLLVFVDE